MLNKIVYKCLFSSLPLGQAPKSMLGSERWTSLLFFFCRLPVHHRCRQGFPLVT